MNDLSRENPSTPEPDNSKPLKILAAEDEARVALLMEGFFTLLKQPVEIVASAAQALMKLKEPHDKGAEYDVLITDKGLEDPEQDGFYLVEEMNRMGLGKGIYTVMLSGSGSIIRNENTEEQLRQKGIQRVIDKSEFTSKAQAQDLLDQARAWKATT